MSTKLIILAIFSFISGMIFLCIGFYFLSKKFLNKMIDSASDKSEKSLKHLEFRCKGSGYVGITFGALTIMWGILLLMFPVIAAPLALVYMIILAIAFVFLMFVFK